MGGAPISLDAEAGQVSAELVRRGIAEAARVRVVVEVLDGALPMAAGAMAGGAFAWLDDEPELHGHADLREGAARRA